MRTLTNEYLADVNEKGFTHFEPKEAMKLALQCLTDALKTKGKDPKQYKWTQNHKELFFNLVKYFNNDTSSSFDLTKGILIVGINGVGKTLIMQAFSDWTVIASHRGKNVNKFFMRSCQEISDKARTGQSIDEYWTDARNFCFDDLGFEKGVISFGNRFEPMEDILASSYRVMKTCHATTNLIPTKGEDCELLQKYGPRVRSRINAMFNLYHLDGKDYRKTSSN